MYQIMGIHNGQIEKSRMILLLKQIMTAFFCYDIPNISESGQEALQYFGCFTEEEMKVLCSENFLAKRLENANMKLDDLLKKMHEELLASGAIDGDEKSYTDIKNKAKGRTQRPARGQHNKKTEKRGENCSKVVPLLEFNAVALIPPPGGYPARISMISQQYNKENSLFLPKNFCNVIFAPPHFYSFLRHFHCLYERLIKARNIAASCFESDIEKSPELSAKVDAMMNSPNKKLELKTERYEQIFLKGLCSLMKGQVDPAKFEDFCRCHLGAQAYLMFTMDKLLSSVFIVS
jgi:histone deacetylase complex regulatory component SIN3